MKRIFNRSFDASQFVLVCHKDSGKYSFTEDITFLVRKYEWINSIDGEIELLAVKIEGNIICLYPAPNNAILISKVIPYSSKTDYIEI